MNNTHPCANKCSEFKGGQCFHCLINETVNRGVYSMHRTESQPVLIVERDNQIIERLKVENVVLQAKVDELQAENKILNQAAATHLRNQNRFKGLYDALVEQLYPYALDLNEPTDTDISKEYTDGYNRARECVHYKLLEMMLKSNEEYIRAQCGMLVVGVKYE